MSFRKEYVRNMNLSLEQLLDLEEAQVAMYDYIDGKISQSRLESALGPVAGILGLIFIKSTPVGIVTAIVGLLSGMSTNEKQIILNSIDNGLRDTIRVRTAVRSLNATLVNADIAFLEFVDEGFRVVTAMASKGFLINGHWLYAN